MPDPECPWLGLPCPGPPACCRATHEEELREAVEVLGAVPVPSEDGRRARDIEAAVQLTLDAMEAAQERTRDLGVTGLDDVVLAFPEYWFVPIGGIGCMGHIVYRETNAVTSLGSGQRRNDALWALNMGMDFEGTDFAVTHCSLAGRDLEAAAAMFAKTDMREDINRAVAALGTPPAHFVGVRVWFHLADLRTWHETGELSFTARATSGHGTK